MQREKNRVYNVISGGICHVTTTDPIKEAVLCPDCFQNINGKTDLSSFFHTDMKVCKNLTILDIKPLFPVHDSKKICSLCKVTVRTIDIRIASSKILVCKTCLPDEDRELFSAEKLPLTEIAEYVQSTMHRNVPEVTVVVRQLHGNYKQPKLSIKN